MIKSGQAVTAVFTTHDATTGAAADATGTPTGVLYVNGTADAATVTVTNIATGRYKAAVTLPSLSAGDVVAIGIAATVNGVAGAGVVWSDVADTKRISDLNDVSQAQVNAEAQTAATAALNAYDGPTNAEMVARTLPADDYFDPAADTVANVTTVGSVTTKTGYSLTGDYDAAKTAASQASVNDLPTNAELATALAGADDATLAAIGALHNLSPAEAQTAATAALNAYDPPTKGEMDTAVSGLSTLTAQQVWEYVTRELTSAGSGGATAQEVWEYATRSLTDKAGFTLHADYDPAKDDVLAAIALLNNLDSTAAQAAAAAALAAYDPPTHAELTTGLSNITISQQVIEDAVAAALAGASIEAEVDAAELAAAVWQNAVRTLTVAAVVGPSAQIDGAAIAAHRGDTFHLTMTGLGDLTQRDELWFTVKRGTGDSDAHAQIQITETGGLLIVARAPAATAAHGTLTVTDAAAGVVDIDIDEAATALMPADRRMSWDIQMKADGTVTTLATGTIQFSADVTQAV